MNTAITKTQAFPIIISLIVGFILLALKSYIFILTNSTAVLADLLESTVHVFVVGFAAYSVLLAQKPADDEHHYGHDRIAFFSAGFEGAMILGAALSIFYTVLRMHSSPTHLEAGIGLFFITFILNSLLGLYLQQRGKKLNNLILTANGKHLIADSVSSLGVLGALIAVKLTGITLFDPLFAVIVATYILWTGFRLLRRSVHGLMDRADPDIDKRVSFFLAELCEQYKIDCHRLRHRMAGNHIQIDVHLLFPKEFTLVKAHEIATNIESKIASNLPYPVDFVSHLEPKEGHDAIHERLLGRKDDV